MSVKYHFYFFSLSELLKSYLIFKIMDIETIRIVFVQGIPKK